MKKFFVFAAAAAFALVACNKENPTVDGSGKEDGKETKATGIVLNELSGEEKYIELYNTTDKEVSLEGVYLVKYDSTKDGGKSTTWEGKAGMKIAANGYVVLESSDLADVDEGGDPNYEYESQNHVFKGGLSGKKNVFIELYNADNEKLSEFKRGSEGAGWNQVKGYLEKKEYSFSRVPNGKGDFAFALPTKGAENGAKVLDLTHTPEM